jgi:lipoprotein NlpI
LAVQDFAQSLSLQPGDLWVQLWLGQAYQGLGERRKAMDAFQAVLESDADDELRQKAQDCLVELQ